MRSDTAQRTPLNCTQTLLVHPIGILLNTCKAQAPTSPGTMYLAAAVHLAAVEAAAAAAGAGAGAGAAAAHLARRRGAAAAAAAAVAAGAAVSHHPACTWQHSLLSTHVP